MPIENGRQNFSPVVVTADDFSIYLPRGSEEKFVDPIQLLHYLGIRYLILAQLSRPAPLWNEDGDLRVAPPLEIIYDQLDASARKDPPSAVPEKFDEKKKNSS